MPPLRRSADGLAQQFLTSLAKLKAAKDCVLGLAATLSLWLLASEDANPCYFASVAAAVLVEQLLQVRQCCLSYACWVMFASVALACSAGHGSTVS